MLDLPDELNIALDNMIIDGDHLIFEGNIEDFKVPGVLDSVNIQDKGQLFDKNFELR